MWILSILYLKWKSLLKNQKNYHIQSEIFNFRFTGYLLKNDKKAIETTDEKENNQ